MGNLLVSWTFKKQNMVSWSFIEIKFRAKDHSTTEVLWIQKVGDELLIKSIHSILIFCDNASTGHLVKRTSMHSRTKYEEIDLKFVREKVIASAIQVEYTPNPKKVAYIFTKPLSSHRFVKLKTKLCVLCKP